MTTAALAARGLAVARGGRLLAAGLDIDLAPGRLTAIAGPSGCGKSSLLAILAGEAAPAAGTVERHRPHALLPQDPGLPGDLTLFDAVRCGALVRHRTPASLAVLPGGDEPARAWREFAALGLAPLARRKVRHCSGGERQRAALARLLVADAGLLLADEPVSHLDAANAGLCLARLRAAADAGAAVAVVLHQEALIARWCDARIDLGTAA